MFRRDSQPNWRAPSWSFFSVDGHVNFNQGRDLVTLEHSDIEIIDCQSIPASAHAPFGEVTGGHLIVRGHIQRPFQ
jgi:hypothetical protein